MTGAGAEGAAVLAARLGHTFGDLSLLQHALAHRSWCGEQEGGAPSNERLEFLGDAVLGLVVAEYCYEQYPEFPEGKLAKVRSAVVNARVLAQVAGRLGRGRRLVVGAGGGRFGRADRRPRFWPTPSRPSWAPCTWTPGGTRRGRWCCASSVLRSRRRGRSPTTSTTRSRLQEKAVRDGDGTPRYVVVGSGPDHDRAYTAEVFLGGKRGVPGGALQEGRGTGGRRGRRGRSS